MNQPPKPSRSSFAKASADKWPSKADIIATFDLLNKPAKPAKPPQPAEMR